MRQLAYGFRRWRYLDATGRLGRDGGLDIRGVEMVTFGVERAAEKEVETEDEIAPIVTEEHEWRIQCKRHKEIGPKLMREIVEETVPDAKQAPYGIVVAAACDVSAETIAALREEALARGVMEAHPWTKAHLEDLLFRPENGHILFAYFGISLGIQRRSQLQRIRELITIKRKLLRAFGKSSVTDRIFEDVLVRDISSEDYPHEDRVPGFASMEIAPWHRRVAEGFHPEGLEICRRVYDGWVKEDGSWDILEETGLLPGLGGSEVDKQSWEGRSHAREEHKEQVPEEEQATVRELQLLPYNHILEVDPNGDSLYPMPHIFCRFDGQDGPYVGQAFAAQLMRRIGGHQPLDSTARRPLFVRAPRPQAPLAGHQEDGDPPRQAPEVS